MVQQPQQPPPWVSSFRHPTSLPRCNNFSLDHPSAHNLLVILMVDQLGQCQQRLNHHMASYYRELNTTTISTSNSTSTNSTYLSKRAPTILQCPPIRSKKARNLEILWRPLWRSTLRLVYLAPLLNTPNISTITQRVISTTSIKHRSFSRR